MQRGSIYDLFFIAALLTVITLVTIISFAVFDQITTSSAWYNTMSVSPAVTQINATVSSTNTAYLAFDTALIFFYIMINLAAVISALFVRTHPIFFFASLLLMIFFIILSAVLANVYYEVASNSFLQSYATQFPLLYNLFLYLPYVSLVSSFLIAVVMYGKTPSGGQNEY